MKKAFVISILLISASVFGQRKIIVPTVNDKATFEKIAKKSGEFSVENISQIKKDSLKADSAKRAIPVKVKPVVRKKKKISTVSK